MRSFADKTLLIKDSKACSTQYNPTIKTSIQLYNTTKVSLICFLTKLFLQPCSNLIKNIIYYMK